MDILPTNFIEQAGTVFKVIFLIAGCAILAINYFHSKESKKMERKLNIMLPGSIHLAMNLELVLSVVFVFLATVVLFLF